MIIVLSPAKTLDYETPLVTRKHTAPVFPERVAELVDILAAKSPRELGGLMNISDQLSEINFDRYQEWEPTFTPDNARPAVLAFKGDVYRGMDVERFGARDLNYAQDHLRILSGLYGILRPLDLIQPYRLEMASKLSNRVGRDLYAYWGSAITDHLNAVLATSRPKALINLASQEYFSSVHVDRLDAQVVTPAFRDFKNGEYKVISFFAKRARGLLASWLILNRINTLKGITGFSEEGYRFSSEASTLRSPVFLRD